ncbi:esterase family protein [Brucepastera parasyntrophica]|uniref:alpha/beta hydrolase n=1 Tax=Brucepastera parasyntrophica TaxID=2880008 RepID=UPI00210AC8D2|nr:alpha/beta hydrolase-fold protein [Brucepastera parasyntrophica]ULQ61014.1 esterase family protein [Brucepastera parasyntrophica]
MEFINPPKELPQNVIHKTFYSEVINHELGYNIFLPSGYGNDEKKYPVHYHLHGWTDNESSDIWILNDIYKNKQAITVFPNNSPHIENDENIPVENIIINEFIPFIENQYRADKNQPNRSISGFSMGGGMAFYYAVKYPGLFGSVTACAGTYHLYYHKDYKGVGEPPSKAVELYNMLNEERYFKEDGILNLVNKNKEKIKGTLRIKMHVGSEDVLFCDNEIMHLYLDSLHIPHEYRIIEKAGHELTKII